jgi:hypothetical protein
VTAGVGGERMWTGLWVLVISGSGDGVWGGLRRDVGEGSTVGVLIWFGIGGWDWWWVGGSNVCGVVVPIGVGENGGDMGAIGGVGVRRGGLERMEVRIWESREGMRVGDKSRNAEGGGSDGSCKTTLGGSGSCWGDGCVVIVVGIGDGVVGWGTGTEGRYCLATQLNGTKDKLNGVVAARGTMKPLARRNLYWPVNKQGPRQTPTSILDSNLGYVL